MRLRLWITPAVPVDGDGAHFAYLHPDLGLGGAERLVVDAAVGVLELLPKSTSTLYTPRFDPARAFPETLATPHLRVVRCGGWVPRAVLGRGHVALATLRMWLATLSMLARFICGAAPPPCVVVIDQVTLPLVLFAAAGVPTLFYIHFPDKLLAPSLDAAPPPPSPATLPGAPPPPRRRGGGLRRAVAAAYRGGFDAVEEVALAWAGRVACNSEFTRGTAAAAFPSLAARLARAPVLYPPVPPPPPQARSGMSAEVEEIVARAAAAPFLLSVARFDGKKGVGLAVAAFAAARDAAAATAPGLRLVLAGGYDEAVGENVAELARLRAAAAALPEGARVEFLLGVGEGEKWALLRAAACVVYTPVGEHFGIVPVEAMAVGTPVVAARSGGPRESVADGETGYLADATADAFAAAIVRVLALAPAERAAMGQRGMERVARLFTRAAFARSVAALAREAAHPRRKWAWECAG